MHREKASSWLSVAVELDVVEEVVVEATPATRGEPPPPPPQPAANTENAAIVTTTASGAVEILRRFMEQTQPVQPERIRNEAERILRDP
jgi:hypothetical protein